MTDFENIILPQSKLRLGEKITGQTTTPEHVQLTTEKDNIECLWHSGSPRRDVLSSYAGRWEGWTARFSGLAEKLKKQYQFFTTALFPAGKIR